MAELGTPTPTPTMGTLQHSTPVLILPAPQGHGGALLVLKATVNIDKEPGMGVSPSHYGIFLTTLWKCLGPTSEHGQGPS